jgi:hypothetical protein
MFPCRFHKARELNTIFVVAAEASLVPHMSDIVKLKKQHAVLLGIEQEMDRFVFYYR